MFNKSVVGPEIADNHKDAALAIKALPTDVGVSDGIKQDLKRKCLPIG
jgi:hypothetical protein